MGSFVIPLAPVVASRPRALRGRGAYYLPRYQAFREAAAEALQQVLAEVPRMGDSALDVHMKFLCPRPNKPSRPWPRGDADNFSKAVLDALTKAELWDDDDQVITSSAHKRFVAAGEVPCIKVRVTPVDL